MSIGSWVLGALICLATVQSKPPPEFIEINGATNPELLPEHVVWGTAFQSLALLRDNDHLPGKGRLETLQLSPQDSALLLAEVDRHVERATRCHEKGVAIAKATPAKKREAAMKANTIACRVALLDAKDRLLAALSPEGATALTMWVLAERAKVKAHVPKQDLDFYRQPR